jgi:hypothetical protein
MDPYSPPTKIFHCAYCSNAQQEIATPKLRIHTKKRVFVPTPQHFQLRRRYERGLKTAKTKISTHRRRGRRGHRGNEIGQRTVAPAALGRGPAALRAQPIHNHSSLQASSFPRRRESNLTYEIGFPPSRERRRERYLRRRYKNGKPMLSPHPWARAYLHPHNTPRTVRGTTAPAICAQ